jgi:hypothetical protein
MKREAPMKFSRRMLVAITPVGVAIGLGEAWHLAGGLVVLMAVQIALLTAALVGVVRVIRRESGEGK